MDSFNYKTALELYQKIGDSKFYKKLLLEVGETYANTLFLQEFWKTNKAKITEHFGTAETSDFEKYTNYPPEIQSYLDKKTKALNEARALHQNLEFAENNSIRKEHFKSLLSLKNEARKLTFLIQYYEETGKVAPEFQEAKTSYKKIYTDDIGALLKRKTAVRAKLTPGRLKKHPKTPLQIKVLKEELAHIDEQLNRLL